MGLVICERLVNMPVQVVPPMYRMLVGGIDGALRDVRSASSFFLLHPMLMLERCRANRIDSVISCLYPARTIFQKKKKHYLRIPRPGVNRNLRKCVLRRANSNRRDRVMGCIRFIPRMILFPRYPPRSLLFFKEKNADANATKRYPRTR